MNVFISQILYAQFCNGGQEVANTKMCIRRVFSLQDFKQKKREKKRKLKKKKRKEKKKKKTAGLANFCRFLKPWLSAF